MAVCNTCKTETARVRTVFRGAESVDECPNCAPAAFEGRFADPSTKKIWIGPEFAPKDYEWRDGQLQMTAEAVAELESRACGIKSVRAQEEKAAEEKAIEHKRRHRRTAPLTQVEIEAALRFADGTLRPLIEDEETVHEV